MRLEAAFVDWLAIRPMNARAERRAMLALVTVFALLVQALVPTLASAAPTTFEDGAICTASGLQAAPHGPAPDTPSTGHACQHCVCPALTAMPSPIVTLQAVTYLAARLPVGKTPPGVRPLTRAPPRPQGQGPPRAVD